MDKKRIIYGLVGVAAVLALLAEFGVSLGLPMLVYQIGGWLLIAGGLLWGMKALGMKDLF